MSQEDMILHFLISGLVFLAVLGVLVLVHELGHFAAAKLFRMKVEEFAFGFGPRLVRFFKLNDTEYNVRAIPLGGFVRIAGMEPEEEEEVEGGFNSKPIWQRALVIFAGPFMSLVLGYVVFIMMGMVWGFVVSNSTIEKFADKSAAQIAGMRPGDTIVSVNGFKPSDSWWLRRFVNRSSAKVLTIQVMRDSHLMVFKVTPAYDKDSDERRLGVWMKYRIVHPGVTGAVWLGTVEANRYMIDTVEGLFSRKIKQAGGPVMIAGITSEAVSKDLNKTAQNVFFLIALLSLGLAVINLVPWPVLDGGHILFLAIEKVRGKKMELERWRNIQAFGVIVIIALAIFMVGYDITRIGKLK
jgi:regulator of sigma E protease